MNANKQSTVCGAFCAECHFYGKMCAGCMETSGKPFYAEEHGLAVCPIYDCCKNQEHLSHCGHCGQMPCQIFRNLRDPNMTDEQFEAGLKAREAELQRRLSVEKRA